MMPSDYAGHLEDAERARQDRDNATGMRIIIRLTLTCWIVFGVLLALLFVVVGAVSSAAADPNLETALPADGVTSIERVGEKWTITTSGTPTEVKVMSPQIGPACGVNYADTLGLCATTTTFTAEAACVYIQVDGIPGENSSDPYVCRPIPTPTPTVTPTPEATPWPTSTPEPVSTSTPQPTLTPSTPVPTSSATPVAVTPSPSSIGNVPSPDAPAAPGQRTLADTGSSPLAPVLVAFGLCVLGLMVGSRAGARLFRLSDDGE